MRLIDAEVLYKKLKDIRENEVFIHGRSNNKDCCTLSTALFEIDCAPTIELASQWVPVSERLPEEGERVLATHLGGINPNNQVIEHIYQCGKFTCGWDMDMNIDSPTFGQRYMGEVIAWMPFPEPYRAERKTDG